MAIEKEVVRFGPLASFIANGVRAGNAIHVSGQVSVDETWFVTDIAAAMKNIGEIFKVRAQAFGGEPQVTQTLIQVGALVMPELLIEIKYTAYV